MGPIGWDGLHTYLGATFPRTLAGHGVKRRQCVQLLPLLHLLRRLTKRHRHRHRVHFKQHRTDYLREPPRTVLAALPVAAGTPGYRSPSTARRLFVARSPGTFLRSRIGRPTAPVSFTWTMGLAAPRGSLTILAATLRYPPITFSRLRGPRLESVPGVRMRGVHRRGARNGGCRER